MMMGFSIVKKDLIFKFIPLDCETVEIDTERTKEVKEVQVHVAE